MPFHQENVNILAKSVADWAEITPEMSLERKLVGLSSDLFGLILSELQEDKPNLKLIQSLAHTGHNFPFLIQNPNQVARSFHGQDLDRFQKTIRAATKNRYIPADVLPQDN